MMNKKFLTMMFSLLLAVGWTTDASAQQLPPKRIKTKTVSQANVPLVNGETVKPKYGFAEFNNGQRQNAPKRSQNFNSTAFVTHTKAWYDQQPDVTWGNGESAKLTAPFTTADGMMALIKRVYTDPNIPGAKYSDAWGCDIPYQTIQYGWNILGTQYNDGVDIIISNNRTNIFEIKIFDPAGHTLYDWVASSNNTLPSSWTVPSGFTNTTFTYGYYDYYCFYLSEGGTIHIPSDFINGLDNPYGYVHIEVLAVRDDDYNSRLRIGNETFYYSSWSQSSSPELSTTPQWYDMTIPATISTPPIENGYTAMMVKLKDGINYDVSQRAPQFTKNNAELLSYFDTYVKEIQLLTDGMRVGKDTSNPNGIGTVFSYTGDLNRFFFISKGKMYYLSSLDSIAYDRAPFYSMYEEFSPYTTTDTQGSADFYDRMKKGESYQIIHDCNSVCYMQHYFSMAGKQGTSENAVSSLVFYIPDDRGNPNQDTLRNYDTEHRPEVGLYLITLNAVAQPSTQQDEHYTVTVTWESNLNSITHNTIAQSYRLWEIITAPDGTVTTREITSLLNDVHDTSLTYDVPQYDDSYTITYYVIGTPDDATNKDTFFAKSNEKDVIIPGLNDFIGLSLKRYECDYDVENQLNYYRNFLSPKNLEYLGTQGVTKAYVGSDGKTLVLYRNDEPVGYLDLKMDGDKCYYRFRYLDQQIEPGYGPDGNKTTTNSSNN